MKRLLISLVMIMAAAGVFGAEGDTIIVRSHDKEHMKFPPSNRNYMNKVKFPEGSKTYRKILLAYELGCPSTGCSTWDYDTHVSVLVPTGMYDSTLIQHPHFRVDNAAPDSLYISMPPTYMTFFDSVNMQTDSTLSDSVFVEEFRDVNNPTSLTNSFYAFETGYYKYYFNATGQVIDSVFENGDSIWYQHYHDEYQVFEVKDNVEVGRLITPYGDNSNVGYYPYTYWFDITDYAPILKDSMEVLLRFAGWQDGFLATLDFIFIEGTPPRPARRIIHKYDGYFAYGNPGNPINPELKPVMLKLNQDESYAQLNYTVTGHGADNFGCSEFCPREYYVKVAGSTKHTEVVWDEDCGMNPIYPQGGTWIYDRANWCPGLPGYTKRHDLTPYVDQISPKAVKVDFQSHMASGGSPGYSINANIITFGLASHSVDAEVLKIISPNRDLLERRFNPICGKPKIVIRNSGSTALTSLKVTYGPVGGTPTTYTWTGNLEFLKTEEVELDVPDWSRTKNVFEVTVSEPNGNTDEYVSNNTLTSKFEIPDEMPSQFRIFYKTNDRSSQENRLNIVNSDGVEVYKRNNVQNNSEYRDTIELDNGCYTLTLTDEGKDGLEFWAGTQSNGFLRFHQYSSLASLKVFEPDFGTMIQYQFTVGPPLGISLKSTGERNILIYPNPSNGTFAIEGNFTENQPLIQIFDPMGREVGYNLNSSRSQVIQVEIPEHSSGVYTIRIVQDEEVSTERLILR